MAGTVGLDEHVIDAGAFRRLMTVWGKTHFRRFPWRLTEDPYSILMAEVMLHRTQAAQVVPVYNRFITRYPDPPSLVRVTRQELHDLLDSLGLHWRIDLVFEMSARLATSFCNQIPQKREDLLSLPGVSEYIANAVRCFAWNLPEALIDTNTVRVVGRVFGLKIRDSSRRNGCFRNLIEGLVDTGSPRSYNYALLDLASQVCTKRKLPRCLDCPIRSFCVYGQHTAAVVGLSE